MSIDRGWFRIRTKRASGRAMMGFFSLRARVLATISSILRASCIVADSAFILVFNDLMEIEDVSAFWLSIGGQGGSKSSAPRSARGLRRIWIDRRDRVRNGFQPLVLIRQPAAARVRA